MLPTIARLIRGSLASRSAGRKTPTLKELQAIRMALLQCIEGCETVQARRLTHQIIKAQTAQQLWLLRNDAYQLISQQTSQTEAARRINALIGCFEGWVEPSQLTRIK